MVITILLIHLFSSNLQLFSSKRGIRLPHGDYIGQRASPCSDMFVQSISQVHSLFIPWLIKYKELCEDNPGCKIKASI